MGDGYCRKCPDVAYRDKWFCEKHLAEVLKPQDTVADISDDRIADIEELG